MKNTFASKREWSYATLAMQSYEFNCKNKTKLKNICIFAKNTDNYEAFQTLS